MILKFFKREKDHRHYLSKGEKYLAAERYADARVEFLEAMKQCPPDATQDEEEIRKGLGFAGDRLGELNIREGEHALNAGELQKAADHFTLACELAFADGIKSEARRKLQKVQQSASAAPAPKVSAHVHGGGSCGGSCGCGSTPQGEEMEEPPQLDLSDEERFSLLVHPLPGDLPKRYASLGEKFARAYLLINDGNDAAAFPILQQLLSSGENDIVIYELALIMYRSGELHECEKLLNRSLQLNPTNPASHLGLVHLLADTGRVAEAIALVQRMIQQNILADQTLLILGDLQQVAGDEAAALDAWSKALAIAPLARAAAERLVPLLGSQGRTEEAKYLVKKHLSGCC